MQGALRRQSTPAGNSGAGACLGEEVRCMEEICDHEFESIEGEDYEREGYGITKRVVCHHCKIQGKEVFDFLGTFDENGNEL